MHGVRSRRLARCALGVAVVLGLGACHGGGGQSAGAPGDGGVDSKAACATLAGLQRAGDALKGVNIADPDAARAALDKAVADYGAALVAFERVGPAELRPRAATVRAAVVARHFGQAAVDRAAIDGWATTHCVS